jgi:hypothetical protein
MKENEKGKSQYLDRINRITMISPQSDREHREE